ncbi:MAG: STAS domain-containing protein [Ilumatobacter sp.]|uniref:STAS domain-containing protein n=1 Tax=Ilumatobacter sp. TaxID=1967498 RepID=UPI003C72FDB7
MLRISFSGELDAFSAADVSDRVIALVDAADDVVVDASRVTFIDSAGLRLIEVMSDRIDRRSGRLWLHEASSCVVRLARLTHLSDVTFCRSAHQTLCNPVDVLDASWHPHIEL